MYSVVAAKLHAVDPSHAHRCKGDVISDATMNKNGKQMVNISPQAQNFGKKALKRVRKPAIRPEWSSPWQIVPDRP